MAKTPCQLLCPKSPLQLIVSKRNCDFSAPPHSWVSILPKLHWMQNLIVPLWEVGHYEPVDTPSLDSFFMYFCALHLQYLTTRKWKSDANSDQPFDLAYKFYSWGSSQRKWTQCGELKVLWSPSVLRRRNRCPCESYKSPSFVEKRPIHLSN